MEKFLLLKAIVGFADRMQCVSDGIEYCKKWGRTLCVDWEDAIWNEPFERMFRIVGVKTVSFRELVERLGDCESVYPEGWMNQIDRPLHLNMYFGRMPPKDNEMLNDVANNASDRPETILINTSTGHRNFNNGSMQYIRVREPFRSQILAAVRPYLHWTAVHLRGSDRGFQKSPDFLESLRDKVAGNDRVVLVSDDLAYARECLAMYPNVKLFSDHLETIQDPKRGTHIQEVPDKKAFNLQTLKDFCLLCYSKEILRDEKQNSYFSMLAKMWQTSLFKGDFLGWDYD